ncbi:MAG: agmatinase, partial [Clostridiales bacterium]|nr:agmatinase [Clostridiales bacterium]
QFGIRSGDRDEFAFARGHTELHGFDLSAFPEAVKKLEGRPVYFTLDLDVLDPSCFPGTGTPEPGGVTFRELLEALHRLNRLNVVACDCVELSPHYDASGISTAAACKAVREILLQL